MEISIIQPSPLFFKGMIGLFSD